MTNSLRSAQVRILLTILVLFCASATTALGIVVEDLTGITEPPADDPGFASTAVVGRSAVYLSDSWVLSARHVSVGELRFDAGTFNAIPGQAFDIPNPASWGGESLSAICDVRLYRIDGDLGTPDVTIASSSLAINDQVVMIGDGRAREANRTTWYVDTSTEPPTWSETPGPGLEQFSGYKLSSAPGRQWGMNQIADEDDIVGGNDADANAVVDVNGRDTVSLFTIFDDPSTGLQHEAQGAGGDSGGSVFHKRGGQWELIGITNAILLFDGQLQQWAVYGNATTFADLSVYRTTILDIMADNPEYSILGDINLDGEVTGDGTGPIASDDLSAFVAGWLNEAPEHNIETWKKGDLDLDGDTDLYDFALLRGAYPPAGAIAGMLGVPEPSTWVLLGVCSSGLIGCWRRPRARRREAAFDETCHAS